MPNHFLTVGLCSWNFKALDEAGKEPDEIDLSPLKAADLCELVLPLPEALRGIVSSHPRRYRAVHKETGEVHPNGQVFHGDQRDQWKMVYLESEELDQLQERHGALDWYGWQSENWGTKWGTYQTEARRMGGDGAPILIEFQSAWRPPCTPVMRLIEEYLSKNYYLANFTWVGHDPSNSKTGLFATPQEAA